MTLHEHEAILITLEHEAYKLHKHKQDKHQQDKHQQDIEDKLIANYKKRKQVITTTRRNFSFTIGDYKEFIILTKDIEQTDRKELERIFSYYDNKNQTFALIPKSLYKILPEKEKLKQLPEEIRRSHNYSHTSRGYEITTKRLAQILDRDTNIAFEIAQAQRDKRDKIEAQRVTRLKPQYTY